MFYVPIIDAQTVLCFADVHSQLLTRFEFQSKICNYYYTVATEPVITTKYFKLYEKI